MLHLGPIAGVAAQDRWVATAGYDNRLILWDAATRAPLARANHDHLVNACAFSHDGQWLVSASSDYSARLWSLPDLRLHAVLGGHGDDVDMARFSPDDQLIATCALDRIVRVFARNGQCLHAMAGHTGNVLALAWIDAARFVTTSVDGTLREWDARTGTCLRIIAIGIRTDCLCIASGGQIIAGDDAGRIAQIMPGEEPQFTQAHQSGIKTLVLADDGRRIVTLGYDRAIAVWDLPADGALALVAREALPALIWARTAAVCADGRIAAGTFGGTYALFDPASATWDMAGVAAGPAINAITEIDGNVLTIGDAGLVLCEGDEVAAMGSPCNFITEANGRLFTGGHLGELYDGETGAVVHSHHAPLNCALAFTRGHIEHLAVGTYTGEILIFACLGQPRLIATLSPHTNAIKSLAASGGVLFSVCANTDIAWHDTANWSELRRIPRAHTRIANAACALGDAAPTPDSPPSFASVGRDKMLRLWLPQGEICVETPHPNSVKCIAASPDGRLIASGSYGGTVAIFDRATMTFAPMRRIAKAGISALCWSSAQGAFLAADYAGATHTIALNEARARLQVAA